MSDIKNALKEMEAKWKRVDFVEPAKDYHFILNSKQWISLEQVVLKMEKEITLLKEELKREREGNNYTAKWESDGLEAYQNSSSIIAQRKIKDSDL
jgi:hypothetical protein